MKAPTTFVLLATANDCRLFSLQFREITDDLRMLRDDFNRNAYILPKEIAKEMWSVFEGHVYIEFK